MVLRWFFGFEVVLGGWWVVLRWFWVGGGCGFGWWFWVVFLGVRGTVWESRFGEDSGLPTLALAFALTRHSLLHLDFTYFTLPYYLFTLPYSR